MARSFRWNNFFKVELELSGLNAEQALKRLSRAGVALLFVKRKDKKTLLIRIYRKDIKKAFAFFNESCYNIVVHSEAKPYEERHISTSRYNIKKVYPVGAYAFFEKLRKHAFLLVGFLFFLSLTAMTKDLVFRVRFTGEAERYQTELLSLVKGDGSLPVFHYRKQDAPRLVSLALALENVSFVSFQKSGFVLTVHLVTAKSQPILAVKDILSPASGEVVSFTVLSGVPLFCVGDEVKKDEPILRAVQIRQNGEEVPSLPIASLTLKEREEYRFFTREECLLFFESFPERERATYRVADDPNGYALIIDLSRTYNYSMGE